MGRHRDMRQHFDFQAVAAVASSGAVVTCVVGTCAPRLKWPHLAPVTGHLCVCVCQAWSGFQQIVFRM